MFASFPGGGGVTICLGPERGPRVVVVMGVAVTVALAAVDRVSGLRVIVVIAIFLVSPPS